MSDASGANSQMNTLRWSTVDDGGEQALFGVDELFDHGRSTGRMTDLEFLHVTARSILNRVPSGSRAPSNWTINVYRGCSHACTYCLAGGTPVLMADGRARPIADLRPGDQVIGTRDRGRRQVVTTVLDHWPTTRRAHRVGLADGTSIVASADHRLLTDLGWRRVGDLRALDVLVRPAGTFPAVVAQPPPSQQSIAAGKVSVLGVEDLGLDIPMFDITTGTGDFIANGVVSHNCFARPTHEYLGLNTGEDFDRKIVVKINAVERLRAELADPRWAREAVAMGTNTDPYQRAEAKYRLTRGVLEVLTEHRTPFSILTKSPLVTRDLDLLVEAARHVDVSVNFSIGTLDEPTWRATEPGTPHPRRRLDAMARLSAAGIRTGALMAPILPGMSDSEEQLREVVTAVRATGGRLLGISALYLRPVVREHFLAGLAERDPVLHRDYLRRYADGAYAPERYVAELYRRAGVERSRANPYRRR